MAGGKSDLDTIIATIKFPISLPSTAFHSFDNHRSVPNFGVILDQLPEVLRNEIEQNGTISQGKESYVFSLADGRFLRLLVKNYQILGAQVMDD
jgi:hypothetical protein